MKTTLIIMPGSPALVGELAPADAVGATLLQQIRSLFGQYLAGNNLPVDLVGSRADAWHTAHPGSFRAWGAPQIQLSGGSHLPELIQRYALGDELEPRVRAVGENLALISAGALTVVALDGSTGLTPRAPSSLVAGAADVDQWCRNLLAGEPDSMSEEELAAGAVREPGLWLELAQLVRKVESAELIAADTSHGVGRYVAVWTIDVEEKEES
ncbi:hypothetical protein [uncultured Corynebacterium sp.]|uniref:hypothetical protein n=1 Tax=uncultured Corynebacterium sp. TaxID=159447 RepID=UPI0025D2F2AF|nr:hypothetical protein [uncultured Corynebacterium sp.]